MKNPFYERQEKTNQKQSKMLKRQDNSKENTWKMLKLKLKQEKKHPAAFSSWLHAV